MPEQVDVREILQRAIQLHREGELTLAENAYREVLEQDPNHTDALHLMGVIAHQMGNSQVAVARIQKSLEINPNQVVALFNLGRVYAESDQPDEAIGCYEQVVATTPENGQAHLSLGHLHSNAKRFAKALECYQRAQQLMPDDLVARRHVAQAAEDAGDWEAAVAGFRNVLEVDGRSLVSLQRLGALLRKMGRLEEAAEVYERYLAVEPDNAEAIHFLAACSRQNVPARAADDYVQQTFDGFAPDFDACLQRLQYRVPDLVADVVAELYPDADSQQHILDLGCGTGLCGEKLRPYADYLAGVDLSPGMLKVAGAKQIYDKLYQEELTAFLEPRQDQFDLIVSGDTFVYLGDLSRTCNAAFGTLRSGGHLIFTVEHWDDPSAASGYQLHEGGRYAHREDYVRQTLADAGFQIHQVTQELLRLEGAEGVRGLIVVALKP